MADGLELKVDGSGGVTQPHEITKAPAGPLPDGQIGVEVYDVGDENPEHASKHSENYLVYCKYPDDFLKAHQISKTGDQGEELLRMIRNTLRGRHGVPHGRPAKEGEHGLDHVAASLLTPLPSTIPELKGKTLLFSKA